MDEAARRVNPAPLRALLRCRVLREENALREVRASIVSRDAAIVQERDAADAVRQHAVMRQEREAGLIQSLIGHLNPAARVLAARTTVEQLAETAVQLEDERAMAEQVRQEAEEFLLAARAAHAQRGRETQTWRRVVERVEAARRELAEAVEEAELEDEAADRYARPKGPPPGVMPVRRHRR